MKLAMLYCGEMHSSHSDIADRIGAPPVEASTGSPTDKMKAAITTNVGDSIVISEGTEPLFQATWMKKVGNCAGVIHLAADEGLLNVFNNYDHYGRFDRFGHLWAHRQADATIAVSEQLSSISKILGCELTKVSHPFSDSHTEEQLKEIEPNIESNRLLVVGKNKNINNFDKLDEIAKRCESDIEFHVCGPNTDRLDSENVTGHGFVDKSKFLHLFAMSSAGVMPAEVQPFPVSVIEYMIAGLPPIVTGGVGSSGYIKDIHPNLVTDGTVDSIAGTIDWYLGFDESERQGISQSTLEVSQNFYREKQLDSFENTVKKVICEL